MNDCQVVIRHIVHKCKKDKFVASKMWKKSKIEYAMAFCIYAHDNH